MAITSLSEVQNDYGSYRGNSLVGKLGAVTSVPNDGLSGIIGKPYPFLNGILVKIGGNIYTDSGYLNALKSNGNPYLQSYSFVSLLKLLHIWFS
jgi:type IV secretory pathway VirB6-like protein